MREGAINESENEYKYRTLHSVQEMISKEVSEVQWTREVLILLSPNLCLTWRAINRCLKCHVVL